MRALATIVALAAFACPALAADVVALSRVDSVTVYPDGASVTRRASVSLPPGPSTIILKGLPPSIDPASIRVAGEGTAVLAIGAVEIRTVPGDPRPVVDAGLEEKLKAVPERRDTALARLEAAERRRTMIRCYAEASPKKLGQDSKPMDVAQWPAAWDAVGGALAKANEESRVLVAELRGYDEEIAALERARPQARQAGAPQFEAHIVVEAPSALVVSYRVGGANWRPPYDARLDTGGKDKKPSLELVRRAEIVRRTGESWVDVALTVSTVRVARGAGAPILPPARLALRAPAQAYGATPTDAPRSLPALAAPQVERRRTDDKSGEALPPVQEQQAGLVSGAFQAMFVVPGRVTIPADGSPKAFRISTRSINLNLSVKTVPVLDPTAYLEASFVNEEEAPLLPGQVAIHRDGVFVGRTQLALIAPGDKAILAFGADDRVKVMRVPVGYRDQEPGFLGSNRNSLREFKMTVKNLHGFPEKIQVLDRVPVADNAAISVEMLPQTTPPTEKVVDDKRGVMSWTYDYAAGEQKEIKLAYRVKWPADRDIVESGGSGR